MSVIERSARLQASRSSAWESAATHCTCPDEGPLCDWHRRRQRAIRRLFLHDYSDDVLELLTRPDVSAGEEAA